MAESATDFEQQLFLDARAGREVRPVDPNQAAALVERYHYLHRRPVISWAYGLVSDGELVGVATVGIPASRNVQISACEQDPDAVVEFNRLWVADAEPRNSESWFVSRVMRRIPPRIVVSYADTAVGHRGYIYRALNWHYAGETDEDRKTPRLDYLVPGRHSRAAFRGGDGTACETVRREPKLRYWTATGDARQRRQLRAKCSWPIRPYPADPSEHEQARITKGNDTGDPAAAA